ncbi:hypothetical protein FJTKL_14341 [Diaporthe vaccinii]|uniref:Uncharacterized protein n=1 Tax=Diaporthe vaccinii TaxID=105482 RepID=A0ABR4E898_9PEZI
MITFAAAFLMKGTTMWSRVVGLSIEGVYVTKLLEARGRQLAAQAALSAGISGRDNGQFAQRFSTDGHHVAFSNAEWGTGNTGTPSFSDELSGDLIFEAFGNGSANDVYDLLTSQMSYL